MTKLNFNDEKLVLNSLELAVANVLDLNEIKGLANYFSQEFKLNSKFRDFSKRKTETLVNEPTNHFCVLFVLKNPKNPKNSKDTQIRFSGETCTFFYKLIEEKKINFTSLEEKKIYLSCLNLKKIIKVSDQITVKQKFETWARKFERLEKKKYISHVLSSNKKTGYKLQIGNRQNSKFIRISQQADGLELTFEIKKKDTQILGPFLFSNNLKTFEDIFIKFLYDHLSNWFIL